MGPSGLIAGVSDLVLGPNGHIMGSSGLIWVLLES